MREIIRTPDPVLVSAIEALLSGEGLAFVIADRHMSTLEAGIVAFPMRILVPDEIVEQTRQLIIDAGLGDELRPLR